MSIERVREAVTKFSQELPARLERIISISSMEKGWKATVEVVEEDGYIDDILGAYEVTFDEEMNVTAYRRRGLRRKSDLSTKDWEKEE